MVGMLDVVDIDMVNMVNMVEKMVMVDNVNLKNDTVCVSLIAQPTKW